MDEAGRRRITRGRFPRESGRAAAGPGFIDVPDHIERGSHIGKLMGTILRTNAAA